MKEKHFLEIEICDTTNIVSQTLESVLEDSANRKRQDFTEGLARVALHVYPIPFSDISEFQELKELFSAAGQFILDVEKAVRSDRGDGLAIAAALLGGISDVNMQLGPLDHRRCLTHEYTIEGKTVSEEVFFPSAGDLLVKCLAIAAQELHGPLSDLLEGETTVPKRISRNVLNTQLSVLLSELVPKDRQQGAHAVVRSACELLELLERYNAITSILSRITKPQPLWPEWILACE